MAEPAKSLTTIISTSSCRAITQMQIESVKLTGLLRGRADQPKLDRIVDGQLAVLRKWLEGV